MAIVQDIGHVILQIGDMDAAVRLYRDVLGLGLPGGMNPVWTVATTIGGSITLYRTESPVPCALPGNETPLKLHVRNFEEAARELGGKGYTVRREDAHSGVLIDPWGNVIGLHDHRESE